MSAAARLPILCLVALLATIGVNILAGTQGLFGRQTGELSDKYPSLITPAGLTFSVWTLIYAGLLAFAIYQVLPAQWENPRLQRLRPLFLLSCLANVGWLQLWHAELLPASLLVMLLLLASLIGIVALLPTYRRASDRAFTWLVQVPFSLYLAWICVATVVNAAVVLAAAGWGGFGLAPATWSMIMLAAVTVIALAVGLGRADLPYLLVIVWALVGVNLGQQAEPAVAATAVATAAVVGLAAVAVAIGYAGRRPSAAPASGR